MPPSWRRVGEVIERGTRMQMQLVDDLLDVSRIVAGKLKVELQPVDLGAVVRAAVEGVSGAAQQQVDPARGRRSTNRVGSVAGDPTRLQQVVSNLLTNAIKFTPERGRVAVTVDAADGHARVKVTDTGTGIEPGVPAARLQSLLAGGQLQHAPARRPRSGPGDRAPPGRAARRTVQAESPGPGKGSTFSVTLPLMKFYPLTAVDGPAVASHGAANRRTAHRDYHELEGLRVLVVDDDLETREAVAEMLKEIGRRGEGGRIGGRGDDQPSRSSGRGCSCATSRCPARTDTPSFAG